MIFPVLMGLSHPLKAPLTWFILVFSIIIFCLSDNTSPVQSYLKNYLDNKEFISLQGRIYAFDILQKGERYPASIQSLAEEALVENNHEALNNLGYLAFRDPALEDVRQSDHIHPQEFQWWRSHWSKIQKHKQATHHHQLGLTVAKTSVLHYLTYQFAHGDFIHLSINLIVFVIFASALERLFGLAVLFVVFLVSGIGAGLFYFLIEQGSNMPLIGSSGSVCGLMAFFSVLFWSHSVRVFYFLFLPQKGMVGFIYIPSFILFFLWILVDIAGYFSTLSLLGGVAHSAHLGGYLSGAFLGLLYKIYKNKTDPQWLRTIENKSLQNSSAWPLLGPRYKTHPF